MTLADLVTSIVQRLGRAGIPYMITGSVVSSFHGEPRGTRDVDIVIEPTAEALDWFLSELPSDEFYVDAEAASEALERQTQFNIVEIATGWKVDFVIRKDRAFSRAEFARRQQAELLGTTAFIATAEDMIIAKLEWAAAGHSDRQLHDVASILAVSGRDLDMPYIERWIRELGLAELWGRVRGDERR